MSEREMERIQQRIYLSRKGLHSIEFEHEVLRIPLKAGEEMSFEILISNHDEPTHVHLSLGEGIRDKIMILQDKVYVIDEEKIAAIVRLPKSYTGAELGTGEIFVSAGYGATRKSFSVEIVEAEEKEQRKERLGKERGKEWELEGAKAKRKERRELTLSSEERVILSRLTVSACAAILFFVFLFFIIPFFSNSPGYLFVSALTASVLFFFIVIYNF
jgi:hypothetical protein